MKYLTTKIKKEKNRNKRERDKRFEVVQPYRPMSIVLMPNRVTF